MPRKPLIRSDIFPYHVTNRTRDKIFYPLPLKEVWNIYTDQLKIATWAFGAHIHAFVLMSNHYHLFLSTPECNIDQIICFVQSEVSKKIFTKTNSKESYFETRYRWSLIKDRNYFANVYRYIYQNPLRAGIVTRLEDYYFSSFHGKAGYSKLEIPLYNHFFYEDLNFNLHEEESWLNNVMEEEQVKLVRKGIRRFEFSLSTQDKLKFKPCTKR
ncbi:MAG: transposase [Bdellovibrionota bacterium]